MCGEKASPGHGAAKEETQDKSAGLSGSEPTVLTAARGRALCFERAVCNSCTYAAGAGNTKARDRTGSVGH